MIILSPTLIPRLAMVTSSTSGDCVLEDCFTVAMPFGEGAGCVSMCMCVRERVRVRVRVREREERERERESEWYDGTCTHT